MTDLGLARCFSRVKTHAWESEDLSQSLEYMEGEKNQYIRSKQGNINTHTYTRAHTQKRAREKRTAMYVLHTYMKLKENMYL